MVNYYGKATPANGTGSGGGSGDAVWGSITGTLGDQTDLAGALTGLADAIDTKQDIINSDNKLSASLVSGLATVATTGAYSDLSGTPTIPTVNNATLTITQNNASIGTFTANASSDVTLNLTDTTYSAFTGADGVNAGVSGLVPAPTATDNDKYLKGDGTWATVSGGGSVTTDNVTIDTNTGGAIQTVGVINKNTNNLPVKFWTGTPEQYNNEEASATMFYGWNHAESGQWSNATTSTTSLNGVRNTQMAYGSGKYICISNNTELSISSDGGDNWSTITPVTSMDTFLCIAYGDGKFVVLGEDSNNSTAYCLYSNDAGTTWTEETLSTYHEYDKIIYYGSGFIAINGTGYHEGATNEILIGTPGAWGIVTIPNEEPFNPGVYFATRDIAVGNGKVVITLGNSPDYDGFRRYIYANISDLTEWFKGGIDLNDNEGLSDSASYAGIPILFGDGIFVLHSARQLFYSENAIEWKEGGILDNSLPNFQMYEPTGIFAEGLFLIPEENTGGGSHYYTFNHPLAEIEDHFESFYIGSVCYGNGLFVIPEAYRAVNTFGYKYYTTTETPSGSSTTLYVFPKIEAYQTISSYSSSDDEITLNTGIVCSRDDTLDSEEYYSIGELNPDYLCILTTGGILYNDKLIATTEPKGYSGTFTDVNSRTVTVENGIITSIV